MERLKRDRMMFLSEIVEMGKKYGLSKSQVHRILEQAESTDVVCLEVAFVYAQ